MEGMGPYTGCRSLSLALCVTLNEHFQTGNGSQNQRLGYGMMLSLRVCSPLTHSSDINRVISQTADCPLNPIRHIFYTWAEVDILSMGCLFVRPDTLLLNTWGFTLGLGMSVEEEARGTLLPSPPHCCLSHQVGALAKAQEGILDVDGESYLLQLGWLPGKSGTGVSGMAAVREAGSLCTQEGLAGS